MRLGTGARVTLEVVEKVEALFGNASYGEKVARVLLGTPDMVRTQLLIPGVYNYCDRCCHRCSFAQRCLIYLETKDVDTDNPAAVVKAVSDSFARATEL